ncbi:hypothetical protein E4U50_000479, partial [Claviceps purpurea]
MLANITRVFAKLHLLRRPPLFLKYGQHRTQIAVGGAIFARTQIRRRRTPIFAESDEIRLNRPSPNSAVRHNVIESFGFETFGSG